MKVSFKHSIALGLVALLGATACSKNNTSFSGNKSRKTISSKESAAQTEKAVKELDITDKEYAEAVEKILDKPFDEAIDDMAANISKAFGNDPVTVDGVDIDDPAALADELLYRFESSSDVFDPYASPREALEDAGVDIDMTDRAAVKEYLADSESELEAMREAMQEVGPFYSMGPVGAGESEESMSLLTQVVANSSCTQVGAGTCSDSAYNASGTLYQVRVQAAAPAGQVQASGQAAGRATAQKNNAAQRQSNAAQTLPQQQAAYPVNNQANQAITNGLPAAMAQFANANAIFDAGYAKVSGASDATKNMAGFGGNAMSYMNVLMENSNNAALNTSFAFNTMYGL